MSPQFVDFNGDGKIDIVAGTFDGSPHVAFGGEKGFGQPEQILDASGARIVLNAFWNFDEKKWDETKRCDMEGAVEGHLTSAVAFDWDGDGNYELLLGDHKTGRIYLRRNAGTNAKPAFATKNVPVNAGGKPIDVPGTVATLRVFDWNGDGLDDLVVSTMGEAYQGGNAGVYLFLNKGKKGAPEFAAAATLIAPGTNAGLDHPERPDAGYYADVGDIDGDGDLDLVVGAYSHWTPVKPKLDAEQKKRVAELRKDLAEWEKSQEKLSEAQMKTIKGLEGDAMQKKAKEFYEEHKAEYTALGKQRAGIMKELDTLDPSAKRESFVWLYDNR